MERFVLAYPDELNLDQEMTIEKLEDINENSNLVEVLFERIIKEIKNNKNIEVLTN